MSFSARGPTNKGYFKGKSIRFRIQKRSPESNTQSPDVNQNSGGTESCGSRECPPCMDSNEHGHHNSVQTPSVSREAPIRPTQLETTDSGSVYFGNGCGNSDPSYHFSTSGSCSSSEISQPVRKGCHRAIDLGDAMHGDFLSPVFLVKKKDGGGEQTCDQVERVEFLCNLPTFQNGGSVFTEAFSSD